MNIFETIRTFPTSPTDEQIAFALKHLTYARIDHWINEEFNTLKWWLQIALSVVSIAIWWKLVDKKRLLELVYYGSLVMSIVILLDQVGFELGLWYYIIYTLPVFPPASGIDYIMMPIIYALVYQYCRTWKSYLIASFLMSGVFSVLLEPILILMGYYVVVKWTFYYSFPIYFAIAVVTKAIVEKIKVIMNRHQGLAAK